MDRLPAQLDDLIRYVHSQHPEGTALVHLTDAVLVSEELGELSDHLLGHFVDQARRAGASWSEIGQSMGVTKQAVQKRFVARSSAEPVLFESAAWGRVTERARAVFAASQDEARAVHHAHVDAEHLLLALLQATGGLSAVVLGQLKVPVDQLRAAVIATGLGPVSPHVPLHLSFAASAQRVRDLTVAAALRLGHNYIGTEHILLALVGDEESRAGQLLREFGVSVENAEARIVAVLDAMRHGQPGTPDAGAAAP
jgi:hypothetical protein